jgi:hypothetical protein
MKITLENYEEFYLDYLDNTLDEQDRNAFDSFLILHPELKLNDEELPVLEHISVTLDLAVKGNLKITEDAEIVHLENLMIGEIEGVNSAKDSAHVQKIISNNEFAASEFKRYQATRLSPNLKDKFENKSALKKRGVIVLWPWLSAVAAVAILFFTVYKFSGTVDPQIAHKEKLKKEVGPKKLPTQITQEQVYQAVNKVHNVRKNKINATDSVTKIQVKEKVELPIIQDENNTNIPIIVHQTPQQIDPKKEENIPSLPDLTNGIASASVPKNTSHYEVRPYASMPNPVSGLTSIAQKIIGTEVDYRSAEPTKRKSGGTHLKIGKFEYSRRKR